jgi:hypothetical protein
MLILTIRTDKPEAEIGLYQDGERVSYRSWPAHRQLSVTLPKKIEDLLVDNGQELKLAAANALAYGVGIPVIGKSGESWQDDGLKALGQGVSSDIPAQPDYGAPVHTTNQKK